MIKRREVIERITIYATFEEQLAEYHSIMIDRSFTKHSIERIRQGKNTVHSVKITYERKVKKKPAPTVIRNLTQNVP